MSYATRPQQLDDLDDQLDALHREGSEILDRADDGLAPDEESRLEEIRSEIDRLGKRKRQVESIWRAAQNPANVTHGTSHDRDPLADPRDRHTTSTFDNPWQVERTMFGPAAVPEDVYARSLSAIERVAGMSDEQRQVATKKIEAAHARGDDGVAALVLATTSPEYVSAFSRWMRNEQDLWSREELDAVRRVRDLERAMNVGTDASGGFLVPESMDPSLIIDDSGDINPVRQLARTVTVSTRSSIFLTSTAVTASYDGEATEVSDDSVTLSEVEITAHKGQAFIPFSIELGLTSNLTAQLARLFTDGKEQIEAEKFVLGTGDAANEPRGFIDALSGSASEINSNTTDTFALSDVYDLDEELPPRYTTPRSRVAWAAHKKIYQQMREAGGSNLDDFWVGLENARPNMLLGYQAMEVSDMDGTINANNENRVLVLANWRDFFGIVDRIGMRIESVPHVFGTTNNRPLGQRGAYAFWMSGSDRLVLDAARALNVT